MATLVTFHAHPDDEAISCGGTMAKAASERHRVVLVVATRGENGEAPEGFLPPGESLSERRTKETEAAAAILGVSRVAFLGYVDSGMLGTPENEVPGSFWQADIDEAAGRLAAILTEEEADVLTVYDPNGTYGHPDHVNVHRVGVRAAELAGTQRVYEVTADRDHMAALMSRAEELGMDTSEFDDEDFDLDGFGTPRALITTRVDVTAFLEQKRAAMAAHASQIAETSFFLAMPPEAFTATWGTEWFVRRGAPADTEETGLFDGLGG
ncbi:MAG: PIG-L family deacetylase [Actinomycetota bacterium]|nr:PIG-L family deacetylase [Actinomycetota bacterium]